MNSIRKSVIAAAASALLLAVFAAPAAATEQELPEVDFCDPGQQPAGSIAAWLAANEVDGATCFDVEVTDVCGSLDVTLTRYPEFASPYVALWLEGDVAPALPANTFPAVFDEDAGGGEVTVSWFIVGPEKDYLVGTALPNFWDGTVETVTVDTDCEPPPPAVCEHDAALDADDPACVPPTTTEPPAPTTTVTPLPEMTTEPPAPAVEVAAQTIEAAAEPELAFTGGESTRLAVVGAGLLTAGAALLGLRRLRTRAS